MITDVGIDLDGVMYDFVGAFKEFCENRMGKELPPATKWDFYHDWNMDDKTFQLWLDDAVEDMRLFNWYNPLPNVISGWEKLREQGLRIHILTHRNQNAYNQTVQWLSRNNLVPDHLHFTENKTIIKRLAKDSCATVDDHIPFYDSYVNAGVISFLHTQPWNLEKKAMRVTDLLDFANKIELFNNYKALFREYTSPNVYPNISVHLNTQDYYKKPSTSNPHTNTFTQWFQKGTNNK